MGLSRRILLALSENPWLRTRAPEWWFVRKATTRFMPGYTFRDAMSAAHALHQHGIGAVFTELGENVSTHESAEIVTQHYADAFAALAGSNLRYDVSVKPTQLGLDVDGERCYWNVRRLVEIARAQRAHVWIDMEHHAYVDRTLAIYRRLVSEFPNVGVCLQAYLYRTRNDLQSLLPLGGGIRLVKGAYREPPHVAYPRKRDVDANFILLAGLMLEAGRHATPRLVFGTHDPNMVNAIVRRAEQTKLRSDAFEFHLLFGIQRAQQIRLAREGYHVSVLISYGDQWFPWYMRRLAERPANVLFVAKSMFSS